MTEINHQVNSMLNKCRAKNLYLFILIPDFIDLDKTVAIHRSRALIEVYAPDYKRGFFSFYNYEKKKQYYNAGKKGFGYKIHPNFRGRFLQGYMLNEQAYRKKKDKFSTTDAPNPDLKYKLQRNSLVKFMAEQRYTNKEIRVAMSKYSKFDITKRGVSNIINDT
jgi:hypothetical protein